MLATGTTLGCGLSICLAVFPTETQAVEPQPVRAAVYRFEDWTVVVQPAPGSSSPAMNVPAMIVEPRKVHPSHIELMSFQSIPPAPHPPAEAGHVDAPIDAMLVNPDPEATTSSSAAPSPATSVEGISRVQSYRAIYDSIPFSRAEYEANPSYRHDATMEFLFGQMRPTVIQRQQRTRIDVNLPAQRQTLPWYNWYGIHNSWSPYSYPPYRW